MRPIAANAALRPFQANSRSASSLGVRTSIVPHLQSTLSLWYLHSNSELQQDGDTGATVASASPSNRYGVEWANYYTPAEHLVFDLDMADSRARFTEIDPDDAAFTNPGGGLFPVQGPGGKRGNVAVGDEGNNAELRADSKATAIASARQPVEENGRYPRPTKGDGGWSARSLNSHTGTPPGAAKRSLR